SSDLCRWGQAFPLWDCCRSPGRNRRHRQGVQGSLGRRASAGLRLPAVPPAPELPYVAGGRVERPGCRSPGSRASRCSAQSRSGHAGIRRSNHARLLCTARGEDIEHHHTGGGWHGPDGSDSGGSWSLWPGRLLGEPPHARDRHPHGDRRGPAKGRMDGTPAGDSTWRGRVAVGLVLSFFACRLVTSALSFVTFERVDPLIFAVLPLLLLIVT